MVWFCVWVPRLHLLINALLSVDPTGLLVDSALTYVQKCIPQPSVEERRAAYLRASELALSNGVTGVVDFGRLTPMGPPEQPWDDLNGTIAPFHCYAYCMLNTSFPYSWY